MKLSLLLALVLVAGCNRAAQPSIEVSANSAASFAQRQVRYMAPLDLIQTLKQTFIDSPSIPQDCAELTDTNRSLIGDSSAATGSPIFSEPGSSFVRWYMKCSSQYIDLESREVSDQDVPATEKFLGPTLAAKYRQPGPPVLRAKFSSLTAVERLAVAREAVERLIGPSEIVADFGFYKSNDDLAQKIVSDVMVNDPEVLKAVEEILLAVAIRDEFLSY